MSYFQYTPTILYKGKAAPNITARVKFARSILDDRTLYHPYTIEDGDRPDSIAFFYYDDSELDWLVLLANDIIDPSSQWPLSQYDLDKYIIDKYDGLDNALSTIKQYELNTGIAPVTTTYYNSLPDNLKKYFTYSYQTNNYSIVTNDWNLATLSYTYLPINEKPYWVPQTVYDYEFNKNEEKRFIKLVDKDYASQLKASLKAVYTNVG